jgi:hypothetical protein
MTDFLIIWLGAYLAYVILNPKEASSNPIMMPIVIAMISIPAYIFLCIFWEAVLAGFIPDILSGLKQ